MAVRVLIVDDEPSILSSTAALLRECGLEVETWGRTSGIVEKLRACRPDILLQDLRMPGLDVEKLVQQVRAEDDLRGVRILLFTASLDADEIADRLRPDGLVNKPFKPDALVGLVHSVAQTPMTA